MLPVCAGEMFLMKIHKTFYSVQSLDWKMFGKCLSCGCLIANKLSSGDCIVLYFTLLVD